MKLSIDASDITTLLRQGTKGRDLVTVQSIDVDEIVLQMVFPRQLTVTLQHFILHSDAITAEMSPWWVRSLVALYLKWRGDDRAKIEGQRVRIQLPRELLDHVMLHSFRAEEGVVQVDFTVLNGNSVT